MHTLRLVFSMGFILAVLFYFTTPVDNRLWKPSLEQKANEYTGIKDVRGDGESIFIHWVAPETIKGSPETKALRQVLRKYVVIGISHRRVSPFGGIMFETPGDDDVAILTIEGEERHSLDMEALPSSLVDFLSIKIDLFSQTLGVAGKAFKYFVFEGKGISSCRKGAFWVKYAGEHYCYETPIPGCQLVL